MFHNWRLAVLHKLGNRAHCKVWSLRWGVHLCCPCQSCSAAFLTQRCKCSYSLHPWLHSFAVPAKVCHKDMEKAIAACVMSLYQILGPMISTSGCCMTKAVYTLCMTRFTPLYNMGYYTVWYFSKKSELSAKLAKTIQCLTFAQIHCSVLKINRKPIKQSNFCNCKNTNNKLLTFNIFKNRNSY